MDTRLPQRMHTMPASILPGMASCSTRNASSGASAGLSADAREEILNARAVLEVEKQRVRPLRLLGCSFLPWQW